MMMMMMMVMVKAVATATIRLRFDCDSIVIRLQFNRATTISLYGQPVLGCCTAA